MSIYIYTYIHGLLKRGRDTSVALQIAQQVQQAQLDLQSDRVVKRRPAAAQALMKSRKRPAAAQAAKKKRNPRKINPKRCVRCFDDCEL